MFRARFRIMGTGSKGLQLGMQLVYEIHCGATVIEACRVTQTVVKPIL